MKQDDLLELLKSVIEEDAIIGRLYRLFHMEKHYVAVDNGTKKNYSSC